MAWATPVNIGVNSNAAVAIGGTIAITVPAGGVPVGALIVVGLYETTTSAGSHSYTGAEINDGANTYHPTDKAVNSGAYVLFYAFNVAALAPGATITFTGQSTASSRVSMTAAYATGGPTTDPLDAAASTSGGATGTMPTQPTATMRQPPAVASSLAIGIMGDAGAVAITITQDTGNGWAAPPNQPTRLLLCNIFGGYAITSSALTYAPTISSGTAVWGEVIGVFSPPNPLMMGAMVM